MFGSSSGQYKPKTKVAVEIELGDGTLMMGSMFVAATQRLSDLLNDDRRFLPFETSEGVVVSLRKSVISRVTELNQRATTGRSIPTNGREPVCRKKPLPPSTTRWPGSTMPITAFSGHAGFGRR